MPQPLLMNSVNAGAGRVEDMEGKRRGNDESGASWEFGCELGSANSTLAFPHCMYPPAQGFSISDDGGMRWRVWNFGGTKEQDVETPSLRLKN